eukprot:gnl/TRDRNA2_/TRDRNA2_88455_c0_seq1.p1 gnl/TRDRNA2_/TRDRNA2_88455_c0~~gnl/TRDRNA2_/TRDRNA2_88455_c0_seq1.p1  ORF type:complete len:212 (+),score=26.49 gnl/TRDRNA2_/TRDRNA2_88455_c0_seq1:59-637(+)
MLDCRRQRVCVCTRNATLLPSDVVLSITMAHFEMWRAAVSSTELPEDGWLLVLEDDVVLQPAVRIPSLMVPQEADMVFLYNGNVTNRCNGKRGYGAPKELLWGTTVLDEHAKEQPYSMASYALRKSAARRLLALMPHGLPEPPFAGLVIDYVVNGMLRAGHIKMYCPEVEAMPFVDGHYSLRTTRTIEHAIS